MQCKLSKIPLVVISEFDISLFSTSFLNKQPVRCCSASLELCAFSCTVSHFLSDMRKLHWGCSAYESKAFVTGPALKKNSKYQTWRKTCVDVVNNNVTDATPATAQQKPSYVWLPTQWVVTTKWLTCIFKDNHTN